VRYTQSINIAREAFALDSAVAAAAERQRALDNRANIAARQYYDDAHAVFSQGVSSFQERDFDQSAGFYVQSRTMFIRATDFALERRRLAEEALQQADRRLIESNELAHRLELIIEGGIQ